MPGKADRDHPRALSLFGSIVLALGAVTFLARLRHPFPLAAYDDDAFYYFQIARNIATGHGSSFDGIHRTNGYHPLWMLVCVAVSCISQGKAFFVLLQAITFLCFAVTIFAARNLFSRVCKHHALTHIATAAVALQCMALMHGGMEIILTLPLALLLCAFRLRPTFAWNLRNALILGALSALVVLSRLDALLWIGLVLCAETALATKATQSARTMRLVAVLAAALPLLLYAWCNHHFFHLWLPVSAAAKELRLHHGPTLVPVRSLSYLLNQAYGPIVICPALLLTSIAILAGFARSRPSVRPEVRALAFTLVLAPLAQLAALCFTSDWGVWS